ncbi:MAG: putative porin [Flavobacteriaceae bacterium]|nr:putative porin [Flavobacteriaceae bacterium]
MNRILLLLLSFFCLGMVHAQDRPIIQRDNADVNQNFNDTLSGRSRRSSSNRNIKNLEAKIQDYKIINQERDTTYVDTSLVMLKDYKFNYLRKDEFDLLPFANMGQTYNTLSYDFSSVELMPKFGARARHFNFKEIEDVNYFYVPTPLTELMFKTAFQQGQLLESFFTVNTSKQFNFSVGYKGLRSLGNYQHSLTSTGNFTATSNYKTKNDRYHARAHIVMQDLMNEENGGIKDDDIINFESGNPEFLDRSVFDPAFENAESILQGKRFHLDHFYNLIKVKDSLRDHQLSLGNILSFTDKYYEFKQTTPNDIFGDAFDNIIHERTTLEDFYAEANATYRSKTLGSLKALIGYRDYNYGYDKLVQINGETLVNRLKGKVISAGGAYQNTIGKIHLDGSFGINVSGDQTGNYLNAQAHYIYKDKIKVGAFIKLNSSAPNYNYLLYQSDYLNYNWQNSYKNIETKQLGFQINASKIADVELDYNTLENYTYFSKNDEGFVKPNQSPKTINYFRIKLSREFRFGKFALNNTVRYQKVIDGEGILNVPEFVSRNTLYFGSDLFDKALFLQTGVTFSYFTAYHMNGYDPVLAEFYSQNSTKLGGFPRFDFFINAKVRQTRIYLKAEHFNSAFTGYNFYSAPNYPYRDFVVRFGLVWNFFL